MNYIIFYCYIVVPLFFNSAEYLGGLKLRFLACFELSSWRVPLFKHATFFSGPRSARDFKSPRHSNRPTAINQELLITIPNSGLILGLPWLCVATPFTPNLCRYMSQSLMTSYDHALKTVIVSCSPKAT